MLRSQRSRAQSKHQKSNYGKDSRPDLKPNLQEIVVQLRRPKRQRVDPRGVLRIGQEE